MTGVSASPTALAGLAGLRPEPASGLGHSETITNAVRCDGCGRFIAYNDLPRSRFDHTPLNEFGPEVCEWTCPTCIEKEKSA